MDAVLRILAVCFALVVSAEVHAVRVQGTFEGVISDNAYLGDTPDPSTGQLIWHEGDFIGDTFTGTFSYDTDLAFDCPPVLVAGPGCYLGTPEFIDMSYTYNGTTYVVGLESHSSYNDRVQVSDEVQNSTNGEYDGFSVEVEDELDAVTDMYDRGSFWLYENIDNIIQGNGLEQSFSWNSATDSACNFQSTGLDCGGFAADSYTSFSGQYLLGHWIQGVLTEANVYVVVPAPFSLAIFGLGLIALSGMRTRK